MHSIPRVLIFLAFFGAFFLPGYAQQQDPETAREYMEVAETMITETKAIDDARGLMVTAANLDTTFIKANYEAGRLHMMTVGKDLAVPFFMRVFRQDKDYRFDIEYMIGRSYQYGLEFDKAIEWYNLYKEKLAKKANYQGRDKVDLATVDRGIFECQNGKLYVSNPGNFSIVNMGREINSEYEDYAPVLTEAEDEIVFTSRRREDNLNENVDQDNKPFEDIFVAKRENGTWKRATNIGTQVNTPYHDSNLGLSADGKTLFIYKDDGGGDIYICEKQADGSWGEPVPIPGIINSSYEEKSTTVTGDGRTLYFVSNRPGGYGGTDIYRATKDSKGQWTSVKNLGPQINTEFDEDGPFIDLDGVTLYFSSKGHKGMGGHDIFKATYDAQKNDWTEPQNLGYPINTPDDDIYFVSSKDSKRAYYSSVRDDGMGYTDIYLITIPEGLKNTQPVVASTEPVEQPKVEQPVEQPKVEQPKVEQPKVEQPKTEPKKTTQPLHYVVKVLDADTKTPLEAKIQLSGQKDNVMVASASKGTGVYDFSITSTAAKDYRLSVEKEGYVFVNQIVRVDGASEKEKTVTRNVEMRKLRVEVSGVLRNLYFDFDKATFKDESYNELNKLERMMAQNPNLKVEISGHTDAVGSKTYNKLLSQRRAEAVKDYLTKKGIDTRRITTIGYGETHPLVSNDDEEQGREINRRVEFKVLQN